MGMIEIRDGTYERDGFTLQADIAIEANSMTAVLGPSGAGKSTLLNIIAGFDSLRSGALFLNGADHSITRPAARPVNFIFQDNNSFAHLSARDNVALGVSPDLRLSSDLWQSVDKALEHVGIGHLAARKPGEMSGGERQRIALARLLVRQKPVLLLDEAFAALGPALRKEMLLLVKKIQSESGLTVLMVTHHPADAKLIADNVVFVDNAVVQKPMAIKSFFASRDSSVQHYLGTEV